MIKEPQRVNNLLQFSWLFVWLAGSFYGGYRWDWYLEQENCEKIKWEGNTEFTMA